MNAEALPVEFQTSNSECSPLKHFEMLFDTGILADCLSRKLNIRKRVKLKFDRNVFASCEERVACSCELGNSKFVNEIVNETLESMLNSAVKMRNYVTYKLSYTKACDASNHVKQVLVSQALAGAIRLGSISVLLNRNSVTVGY